MDNSMIISGASTSFISNNSQIDEVKADTQNKEKLSELLSQPERSVTEREAEQVVVQLSDLVQNLQRDLLFSVDKKNGGTILKVVDRNTEEIIREIPSEDIRRIKEKMREVSGLLFKDST